ncbi:MAG: hypothetical protein LC687_02940, partial [Actinobacteria bacterium]|nr:hypothetical protein [Actinomycetota bacterium]
MILALITLLSGLAISGVAIYYSVLGLAAIFAASPLAVIVMGAILETSKLVAAWWLKWNWKRAPLWIKSYLLTAVIVLMLITSMGIFGFLSKAHVEQGVPTGNLIANIELIDERIALEDEIISQARRDISILNDQIDRYTALGAVTKGVEARQAQEAERTYLNDTIRNSQNTINELRTTRLESSSGLREVEAKVGPIRYIAQLIYGNSLDDTILEKSVVWVIIIIVLVFDPLAILLLLSAQLSFIWYKEEKNKKLAATQQKEEDEHITEMPAAEEVQET